VFSPRKFDCHKDSVKTMIVGATPIQRFLSEPQSMSLSTVKYKISNDGDGMTNTAITTKWNQY
jgi:hypothetical protein